MSNRPPRAAVPARMALVAVGLLVAAAACTRSGPPAPVDDRTGVYGGSGGANARPARGRKGSGGAEPLHANGRVVTTRPDRVRVRRGDTLYAIARREKVPLRSLIEANRLAPPYTLRPGQTLRVPAVRLYVVAKGDTLWSISQRFDVTTNALARENDLAGPQFEILEGQRLVLPWRGPAAAPPDVRTAKREEPRAAPRVEARQSASRTPSKPGRRAAPVRMPARSDGPFLWPVRGRIVSGYGSKGGGLHNDGINIAAREGEIVRASENGVVAYAGNELRGYGNLLLIRHADGWVSAYAHNGQLLVNRGDVVQRGQPIARVGRSGAVASPQLHFELRRGRKAVDPRQHLGKPA